MSFIDPSLSKEEVEKELDLLNQTSVEINALENRLEVARTTYQTTLSDMTKKLDDVNLKIGKSVSRARPFYDARRQQESLMGEVQSAATRYIESCNHLEQLQSRLSGIEFKLFSVNMKSAIAEPELLEELNKTTKHVNESKAQVSAKKANHERLMEQYAQAEKKIVRMEVKSKRDIAKSRPYFILHQCLNQRLQEAKLHVDLCAEKVAICKALYADAMSRLEQMSNMVHAARSTGCSPDYAVNSTFIPSDTKGEAVCVMSNMTHVARSADCAVNSESSTPTDVRGEGVGAESDDPGDHPHSDSPKYLPQEKPVTVPSMLPGSPRGPLLHGLMDELKLTAKELSNFESLSLFGSSSETDVRRSSDVDTCSSADTNLVAEVELRVTKLMSDEHLPSLPQCSSDCNLNAAFNNGPTSESHSSMQLA